jgi:adenylate kinase
MAPTRDDIHEVVAKLEARVKELEARLLKAEGGASSVAKDRQSVRIILMGPPGAGKSRHCLSRLCVSCLCLPLFVHLPSLSAIFILCQWLIFSTGKGTQAPKIKERFSCCHLVSFDLVFELALALLIRMLGYG